MVFSELSSSRDLTLVKNSQVPCLEHLTFTDYKLSRSLYQSFRALLYSWMSLYVHGTKTHPYPICDINQTVGFFRLFTPFLFIVSDFHPDPISTTEEVKALPKFYHEENSWNLQYYFNSKEKLIIPWIFFKFISVIHVPCQY